MPDVQKMIIESMVAAWDAYKCSGFDAGDDEYKMTALEIEMDELMLKFDAQRESAEKNDE